MGFFLLISAYFVPGSYDRKGASRFLKDRLIRLGIPLALYSWIMRPLLAYLDPIRFPDEHPRFWDFITANYFKKEAFIGGGPLWFIETLLIFSVLYVLWRIIVQHNPTDRTTDAPFPCNSTITFFALLLGVIAFLIRLWFPMGWNFVPLNLQLPFFGQYIALFIVGLNVYRNDWLQNLPERTGRLWLRVAIVLIFLFWPVVLGGGALEQGFDLFRGGWYWQALIYAIWESFLGISMCIGLIYVFYRYGNRQGKITNFLERNAYTAYLIHEVVIIAIAYAVIDVTVYPLLKFFVVGLVAVPLCFVIS